MGSYVPTTAAEREEMLALIGVDSLEGLYKAVPQEMLLRSGGLNIPEGLSELAVREAVTAMAEKNRVFKTVLRGAGAYRHFIPAEDIELGKHLNADVRGRMVELEIVPMPFYKLER